VILGKKNDKDDSRQSHEKAMTAQDRLRAEILNSALYDWVPMREVQLDITKNRLAETLQDQQELALSTIRSLLKDGLVKIGGLPEPGEVPDWGLPVDAAMDRLNDRYVTRHDDPVGWEFTTWLGLTETGRRVAQKLRG
jgi:hypothetical protein